ncbi:hypothetical protein BYT27DRAFT_6498202 [Phlegmacium glaucopus]|nr:hypothetical protein BYT27DRAFT_6552343 [Phlegmacium glaucopus]KAF8810363.1 hypothetical protein BYT27DRAFT_6498202 [Phlegmacium glaucopus]
MYCWKKGWRKGKRMKEKKINDEGSRNGDEEEEAAADLQLSIHQNNQPVQTLASLASFNFAVISLRFRVSPRPKSYTSSIPLQSVVKKSVASTSSHSQFLRKYLLLLSVVLLPGPPVVVV